MIPTQAGLDENEGVPGGSFTPRRVTNPYTTTRLPGSSPPVIAK